MSVHAIVSLVLYVAFMAWAIADTKELPPDDENF